MCSRIWLRALRLCWPVAAVFLPAPTQQGRVLGLVRQSMLEIGEGRSQGWRERHSFGQGQAVNQVPMACQPAPLQGPKIIWDCKIHVTSGLPHLFLVLLTSDSKKRAFSRETAARSSPPPCSSIAL